VKFVGAIAPFTSWLPHPRKYHDNNQTSGNNSCRMLTLKVVVIIGGWFYRSL